MNAEIVAITLTRDSRDWIATFNEAGVPAGPINTVDEVFADPQVQHLGMAAPVTHPELGDIELVGQPIQMSGIDFKIRSATPALGAHTEEILREAGYSSEEIEALRAAKAIGPARC